jgi:nucleoside-diphosphate-sugar epimerase
MKLTDKRILVTGADGFIGEVMNIGAGNEISVGDTLNLIKQLMHSDVTFITDDVRIRLENSEVLRLCYDNTKIHNLTGFTPQYSLEQGLQQCIDWFTRPENLARYKIDIYNV